jgi:iron complex outermembrane receptor protein
MRFSVRGAARSALGSALAAALAGMAGVPAIAAEPERAQSGVIEEVIVTGTKREQSAQDVPISISALSEDMLKKQFRNDILVVGEMTPGVTLGQQPGFRAVAGGIRGTGQNSILVTQDSSVVLLVDDYSLTDVQAQFIEMFDVERVEVYRGPQGTLFGKSATGGAISIITKRPEMNEMGADIRYQYGVFNGDDGPSNSHINKTSVAVNIPLIDDTLAMRMVGI